MLRKNQRKHLNLMFLLGTQANLLLIQVNLTGNHRHAQPRVNLGLPYAHLLTQTEPCVMISCVGISQK